jgi:hypothetical protein
MPNYASFSPLKDTLFNKIVKQNDSLAKYIPVRYHSGGSMELNARILLLAYMVYLKPKQSLGY